MNHTHDQLQAERIIVNMSGDVALALLNTLSWAQKHHFDREFVYCTGEKHVEKMADNLEEFATDLRDKVVRKNLVKIDPLI